MRKYTIFRFIAFIVYFYIRGCLLVEGKITTDEEIHDLAIHGIYRVFPYPWLSPRRRVYLSCARALCDV